MVNMLRYKGLTILVISIIISGLCGCSQPAFPTNSITGYVYLNGYSVGDANIEAISINGTDRINTTTNEMVLTFYISNQGQSIILQLFTKG